jgi:activator of 2-hydroxyglutaryl-CoA dehydratase
MQKLVQEHPELTDVHVKGEKSGHKLDATIGQPLVSLEVTGETRSTLEYTVCFASGTLYFAYQEP